MSLILRRLFLFLAALVKQFRVTHWRIVNIVKTINLPRMIWTPFSQATEVRDKKSIWLTRQTTSRTSDPSIAEPAR
jgi:hypothetical protein